MRHWRAAVVIGFVLAGSVILAFGQHDLYHDADSVLPAIMSVQKLTWFYWGQNRFANLLPLLASPVRSVDANLHLQFVLRQVCGFGAVFLVLGLVGERRFVYDRFFAGVLALMLAAGSFVGSFFNPAVPQAVAAAVFAAGLWLARSDIRPRRWLVVGVLFWGAFLVDMSLAVFAVPVAFVLLALGTGGLGSKGGCAAVTVAAGLAWAQSQLFTPRTPVAFRPTWHGLNDAATAILGEINLTALAGGLLATAGLAACLRRSRAAAVAVPVADLAVLGVLVATAWAYANLSWVQDNGNATRYYNDMKLFAVVVPAGWAVMSLRAAAVRPGLAAVAWRIGLPMAALLAVAWHAGLPGRLSFVNGDRTDPLAINDALPAILAAVPKDRPMVVTGDYWSAVPLVYLRLSGRGGRESYAATDHWNPMRPVLRRLLLSDRAFTLVCLGTEAGRCPAVLAEWTGAADPGRAAATRVEASLKGVGGYAVLDMVRGPSTALP